MPEGATLVVCAQCLLGDSSGVSHIPAQSPERNHTASFLTCLFKDVGVAGSFGR